MTTTTTTNGAATMTDPNTMSALECLNEIKTIEDRIANKEIATSYRLRPLALRCIALTSKTPAQLFTLLGA